jgi:hypothetical protein
MLVDITGFRNLSDNRLILTVFENTGCRFFTERVQTVLTNTQGL